MRSCRALAVASLLLTAAGAVAAFAQTPPSSAPQQAPQQTPPPVEEVLIPAGTFVMGHGAEGDCAPEHEVYLDAFHIDRHEVTNARYLAFCEATEHRLPEFWGMERYCSGPDFPDHPVVGVSWWDARDYAEWCGKRLPTEAEWECAARGGLIGALFPWGDELSPEHANYARSEHRAPVPVGSYPPNGFGLHDMIGNASEWVEDRYGREYYAASPRENPAGPEVGRFRIFRGGGWHTGPGCARVHFRNALPSNWVDFAVGFRCVRDAAPAGEDAGTADAPGSTGEE